MKTFEDIPVVHSSVMVSVTLQVTHIHKTGFLSAHLSEYIFCVLTLPSNFIVYEILVIQGKHHHNIYF